MVSYSSFSLEQKAEVRWYAMRAYKCKKKAEAELSGKDGLEYFIPKRYAIRTYHGVKSKRLVPVIPSLVFVHACHNQIMEFKLRCKSLQFIICNKTDGKEYITVPDKQMYDFIKVASQYGRILFLPPPMR